MVDELAVLSRLASTTLRHDPGRRASAPRASSCARGTGSPGWRVRFGRTRRGSRGLRHRRAYDLLPSRHVTCEIVDAVEEMSQILGRPVDLVSRRAVHPLLREYSGRPTRGTSTTNSPQLRGAVQAGDRAQPVHDLTPQDRGIDPGILHQAGGHAPLYPGGGIREVRGNLRTVAPTRRSARHSRRASTVHSYATKSDGTSPAKPADLLVRTSPFQRSDHEHPRVVRVCHFPNLNRPGFHGGSQSPEDEGHGCTEEVSGRVA